MPRKDDAEPTIPRGGQGFDHLGSIAGAPFIWLTMPTCMS
jgi:hypothetical protein